MSTILTPMSTTRLLVLGAVRIFQPVHGYLVRRELVSWHAEEWAHLNPGSIYNALRTLAREGYLREAAAGPAQQRTVRTSYELTADGETEFLMLLRSSLWDVDPYAPDRLLAAWSFAWVLTREEVVTAFEHRLEQIRAGARAARFMVDDLTRDPAKPTHVAEHVRLTRARLDGEASWTRDVLKRLRAGEYWFDGEPHSPWEAGEQAAGATREP